MTYRDAHVHGKTAEGGSGYECTPIFEIDPLENSVLVQQSTAHTLVPLKYRPHHASHLRFPWGTQGTLCAALVGGLSDTEFALISLVQ